MQEPKTNGNIVLIVLVVLLVVLLTATSAAAAYFYARSQVTPTPNVNGEETRTLNESSVTPAPQPSAPVAEKFDLPVVVFVPAGLFNESLKKEIRDRIVDPFILYNDTEYNRQNKYNPVSISISVNDNAATKANYPYLFEAVSQNGGTSGFVITVKDGKVSYYVPECMVKCEFTEKFKAEYPEIVALANP